MMRGREPIMGPTVSTIGPPISKSECLTTHRYCCSSAGGATGNGRALFEFRCWFCCLWVRGKSGGDTTQGYKEGNVEELHFATEYVSCKSSKSLELGRICLAEEYVLIKIPLRNVGLSFLRALYIHIGE